MHLNGVTTCRFHSTDILIKETWEKTSNICRFQSLKCEVFMSSILGLKNVPPHLKTTRWQVVMEFLGLLLTFKVTKIMSARHSFKFQGDALKCLYFFSFCFPLLLSKSYEKSQDLSNWICDPGWWLTKTERDESVMKISAICWFCSYFSWKLVIFFTTSPTGLHTFHNLWLRGKEIII